MSKICHPPLPPHLPYFTFPGPAVRFVGFLKGILNPVQDSIFPTLPRLLTSFILTHPKRVSHFQTLLPQSFNTHVLILLLSIFFHYPFITPLILFFLHSYFPLSFYLFLFSFYKQCNPSQHYFFFVILFNNHLFFYYSFHREAHEKR